MLPEPTLTFTIPSLHDGTILNCRVYHPWSLSPSPRAPPWRHDAAVVAHPYAPLGGTYDDAIVGLIATTLLRAGFMVATFNFRGAFGSAGRTSWTAKAERADYMSVAGFLAHYTQLVDPFRHRPSQPPSPTTSGFSTPILASPRLPPSSSPSKTRMPPKTTTQPLSEDGSPARPLLVFAGYSYGALITSQLPPLSKMLASFAEPECGTPAAEIRLRAEHLASTQNAVLGAARRAEREARSLQHGGVPASPRKSLNLRVGGEEEIGLGAGPQHHNGGGGGRRKSHDSHRSIRASIDDAEEKLRRGVSDLLAKTMHHSPHRSGSHHHGGAVLGVAAHKQRRAVSSPSPGGMSGLGASAGAPDGTAGEQKGTEDGARLPKLAYPPSPTPAYLLVSPPLSLVGNLTSLTFSLPMLPSLPKRLARRSSVPPAASEALADPGVKEDGLQRFQAPQRAATEALGMAADAAARPATGGGMDGLDEADRKMVENATLVVYGDSDVFVSNRRMRDWASRLQAVPGSRFRAHEVSTAGHFWQSAGGVGAGADSESVVDVLHHAVRTFADSLLCQKPPV